jgi:hypothetical protein
MPRTLNMLRFLGSSDAYPRRASAASALGSLTEPRRCESESERFTMMMLFVPVRDDLDVGAQQVAVDRSEGPKAPPVESKVAQLSRAAMLKSRNAGKTATKKGTKSKQLELPKTKSSSQQRKGPRSSPPTPGQATVSVRQLAYLSLADPEAYCVILLSRGFARTGLVMRQPCTLSNAKITSCELML